MRRVVVGLDHMQRSTVMRDGAAMVVGKFRAPAEVAEMFQAKAGSLRDPSERAERGMAIVKEIWRTPVRAELLRPDEPYHEPTGVHLDAAFLQTQPGETCWIVAEYGPNFASPLHHTDTIDYGLVISGEIDLLLESDDVRLRTGDTYVLPGVAHGWRAGAIGCTLAVVLVGAIRR